MFMDARVAIGQGPVEPVHGRARPTLLGPDVAGGRFTARVREGVSGPFDGRFVKNSSPIALAFLAYRVMFHVLSSFFPRWNPWNVWNL
jgi:hypothetical protein